MDAVHGRRVRSAPLAGILVDVPAMPGELHQAKALLLRQMALQQSSEDAIAGLLLARAQIGLPLDESRRMGQRFFDMTADEVRAAFAKWIRPEDFVQVVRGPQP